MLDMAGITVDVIIPVYKPDERLIRIIELLENQNVSVRKIIIINTEQKYWDSLASKSKIEERYDNIYVSHIKADEFDHGGTRKMAAKLSDAEYIVFMTQDAMPYDETLIENLITPLAKDVQIAAGYARQLPYDDASVTEKYIRSFNYPDESRIKGMEDLDELGIKTFFCSNVCAIYRHKTYDELGGFVDKTIFNEDMIFAAGAQKAGKKIAYISEAKVYHSHNYKAITQLHRNFDLAVSQREHPEVFDGVKSEGEGIKLVKDMAKYLRQIHKSYLMPGFVINCGCRYIGYRLGKVYNRLPKGLVLRLTSNKAYWR